MVAARGPKNELSAFMCSTPSRFSSDSIVLERNPRGVGPAEAFDVRPRT
jgi:hypothetical protein